MKTVFSCDKCGYRYAKAWYEPMWLARRQYEPEHPNVHIEWAYAMANPNSNPIAQSWVRAERERIIALFEEEKCENGRCMSDPCRNCQLPICDIISLIRGEGA